MTNKFFGSNGAADYLHKSSYGSGFDQRRPNGAVVTYACLICFLQQLSLGKSINDANIMQPGDVVALYWKIHGK